MTTVGGDLMDDGRRCTAHAKQTGERCRRAAVLGATVCTIHGGGAPHVRADGQRRSKLEAAARAVATFGLPRSVDPHAALLEEIARTAGAVDWLGEIVGRLASADVVFGISSTEKGVGAEGPIDKTTRTAAPNVWVDLYQWERKHLVDVCKAAISSGIAARQVELAEEQGMLVVAVLRAVFADSDLGLTEFQQAAARLVAARHLRTLDA